MLFGRPMKAYLTVHDAFHLHAVCGLYVLLHACYRLGLWAMHQQRSFQFGPDVQSLASLAPHAVLSLTGLAFFPLPAKRNAASPLLWPEGRLHSVVFAARSFVACVLAWLSMRTNSAAWLWLRGPVALATCLGADMVTAKYGSVDRTTMRDMPWPSSATSLRPLVTLYYSISQIAATTVCILSYRLDEPFWVLCVVQISAFLFTCVRKGILGPRGWHLAYALLLGSGYALLMLASPVSEPGGELRNTWSAVPIIVAAVSLLRFRAGANKYALWGGLTLLHWAALWTSSRGEASRRLPFFEFVTK